MKLARYQQFACNEFQEPGTEEEIKKFATEKYGVQFDMFAKINVNGDDAHPLYKYLKKKQGGTFGEWVFFLDIFIVGLPVINTGAFMHPQDSCSCSCCGFSAYAK